MAQNIYDNDEFFAGYLRLPRSVAGLEGAPEWPALRTMLPDLHGGNVLDRRALSTGTDARADHGYFSFFRYMPDQRPALSCRIAGADARGSFEPATFRRCLRR